MERKYIVEEIMMPEGARQSDNCNRNSGTMQYQLSNKINLLLFLEFAIAIYTDSPIRTEANKTCKTNNNNNTLVNITLWNNEAWRDVLVRNRTVSNTSQQHQSEQKIDNYMVQSQLSDFRPKCMRGEKNTIFVFEFVFPGRLFQYERASTHSFKPNRNTNCGAIQTLNDNSLNSSQCTALFSAIELNLTGATELVVVVVIVEWIPDFRQDLSHYMADFIKISNSNIKVIKIDHDSICMPNYC